MNTTLKEAFNHITRTWPDDQQQVFGEAILDGAARPNSLPVIELTPEEHAMVDEALADVAAGNYASPEAVEALFAKHRA